MQNANGRASGVAAGDGGEKWREDIERCKISGISRQE
jgi:hypothetical protein